MAHPVQSEQKCEICVKQEFIINNICLFHVDVTKTGKGNRKWGMGVWEQVCSSSPSHNLKWQTKEMKTGNNLFGEM